MKETGDSALVLMREYSRMLLEDDRASVCVPLCFNHVSSEHKVQIEWPLMTSRSSGHLQACAQFWYDQAFRLASRNWRAPIYRPLAVVTVSQWRSWTAHDSLPYLFYIDGKSCG